MVCKATRSVGFLERRLRSNIIKWGHSFEATPEILVTWSSYEVRTCCRKTLCISYKDHVTNEEVCAKIQQALGPHEDQSVVKRANGSLPFIRSGKNYLARHSE